MPLPYETTPYTLPPCHPPLKFTALASPPTLSRVTSDAWRNQWQEAVKHGRDLLLFLQPLYEKVDLGYQGILTDYVGEDIHLPHKKPRKSKNNPETSLTDEQKLENQALSKIRIFVENAIGGLKRYNILVHRFRNHRKSFASRAVTHAHNSYCFSALTPHFSSVLSGGTNKLVMRSSTRLRKKSSCPTAQKD